MSKQRETYQGFCLQRNVIKSSLQGLKEAIAENEQMLKQNAQDIKDFLLGGGSTGCPISDCVYRTWHYGEEMQIIIARFKSLNEAVKKSKGKFIFVTAQAKVSADELVFHPISETRVFDIYVGVLSGESIIFPKFDDKKFVIKFPCTTHVAVKGCGLQMIGRMLVDSLKTQDLSDSPISVENTPVATWGSLKNVGGDLLGDVWQYHSERMGLDIYIGDGPRNIRLWAELHERFVDLLNERMTPTIGGE